MPQNDWAVLDTSNGLYLTSYNPNALLCGFGNIEDRINFTEQGSNDEAAALNTAYGVDYFIGTHPKPH